jgi:hypothetical protein
MDRAVAEATFDRESAARRICQDKINLAGIARREAKDAAYLLRDKPHDALRARLAELKLQRAKLQAEIDQIPAQMAAFKANPPEPDLQAIEAEYEATCKRADDELAAALRKIFRDRMYGRTP